MGLFRLLLIALVIGIVIMLLRRQRTPKRPQGESQPSQYDPMVRCAHCGIHLPRDRAIRSADGHYYCSTEHRDANQR
ncbi:MAG TPA: PP0621 family protein [Gammaproteobacteria bacterium]